MQYRCGLVGLVIACGSPSLPPQPTCTVASTTACPMIEFLPPSQPVGAGGGAIAAADINCDGAGDVVTSSGEVYVGSPSGLMPQEPLDIAGANAIAILDADGDGHYDVLAVRNESEPNGAPAPGSLRILFGHGDGTFDAPLVVETGGIPVAIGTGDFDGDGVLDVVVANAGDHNVSLFTGRGDRRFALHRKLATTVGPTGPNGLAVTDLDRDGNSDVLVGHDGQIDIMRGDGDGNLSAPSMVLYDPSQSLGRFLLADVNADQRPDLVMIFGSAVVVAVNTGPLAFAAPMTYAMNLRPIDVAVADLDGDGHVDLAVADSTDPSVELGYTTVLRGNGDGTFRSYQMYASGYGTSAIAAADVDGDGRADLAVMDATTLGGLYLLHAACP